MRKKIFQISIIIISTVFSLLSIFFGNRFFTLIGITDNSLQTSLINILSIFFVFLGFLFTFFSLMAETQDEIKKIKSSIISEIKQFLPDTDSFKVFNGIEALILIADKLNFSTQVLNTKITTKDFELDTFYTSGTDIFPKAIVKAIKSGLIFKEVTANYGKKESIKLMKEVSKMNKKLGSYEAFEIDFNVSSMINFIILHMKDGTKELWFGWLVSKGNDIHQPVYRSTDNRLINLFEMWHNDLCKNGKKL